MPAVVNTNKLRPFVRYACVGDKGEMVELAESEVLARLGKGYHHFATLPRRGVLALNNAPRPIERRTLVKCYYYNPTLQAQLCPTKHKVYLVDMIIHMT